MKATGKMASELFERQHQAPKIASLNLAERVCHTIHMLCDKSRTKPGGRMTASSLSLSAKIAIFRSQKVDTPSYLTTTTTVRESLPPEVPGIDWSGRSKRFQGNSI